MTTAQQEQLKSIVTLLQSSVPKSDLDAFLSKISEILASHKQITGEVISRLEQTYLQSLTALEGKHSATLAELEKRVNNLFVGDRVSKMEAEHSQKMSAIDSKLKMVDVKMAKVKNGEPGPRGLPGERGLPGKSENLDILLKQIEELKTELADFKRRNMRLGGGFSKIAMDSHHIDDETLTGLINGINKIFTLSNTPNPTGSLKVYLGGTRQRITEDYTLSKNIITFVTAPPTGSILIADYRC